MDSHRAKEILSVYRSGRDDPSDPQFADALAQARRDPELGQWLEQQAAVDNAIRSKLNEAPVAEGLLQRLLDERKVAEPVFWRQKPLWLAAAAILIALLAAAGFWLRPQRGDDFVAYRRQMARFIARPYKLDFEARNIDEAQRAVAKLGWPSDYVVPTPMRTKSLAGGCTLRWRDQKVTLICWSYRYNYWMFVVDRAALPDPPAVDAPPRLARFGKIATASWTAGNKTYIVAAVGDEALVRTLL